MSQMYMIIDVDRCWGCRSCQVACKQEHGLPAEDFKPVEVFRVENMTKSGVHCDFIPVMCQHCDAAPCMEVCPFGAWQRTEEGIVTLDEDKCVGCTLCFRVCPYEAIGVKMVIGQQKASKCDMCASRRARGFLTACEQHCVGGAITTCTAEQKDDLIKDYPYQWSTGRVIYVSRVRSSLGLDM